MPAASGPQAGRRLVTAACLGGALQQGGATRAPQPMGAISTAMVMAGAAVAHAATRMPLRQETLETAAGVLIIAGLAMIGCSLPVLL